MQMHIRKQKPHSVLSALREVTRNEGTNEITLRGHQQQQQLVLSPPARGRLLPSAFPAPRFPLALKNNSDDDDRVDAVVGGSSSSPSRRRESSLPPSWSKCPKQKQKQRVNGISLKPEESSPRSPGISLNASSSSDRYSLFCAKLEDGERSMGETVRSDKQ